VDHNLRTGLPKKAVIVAVMACAAGSLAACAWKLSGETNVINEPAHSTQRRNQSTIDLDRPPRPSEPIYRYDNGRTHQPCNSCRAF
jgi:hypothetical protein